jgi:hypothetical protein
LYWVATFTSRWKLKLGDSVRDGVVQAPIQGSEFIDGERHIPFERQVGDGLAEIPVVVDDLIHGVPHLEEFLPVGCGCHPHLGQGERVAARRPRDPKALGIVIGFLRPQRSRELLQEEGNALGELLGGGGALGALLDLPPTSRDRARLGCWREIRARQTFASLVAATADTPHGRG